MGLGRGENNLEISELIFQDVCMLSPVLIFGSGIHRQWLCERLIADHRVKCHANALQDWGDLLASAAKRLDISQSIEKELSKEMPTLQWERMVQALCDTKDKTFPAFKCEKILRKVISEILNEAERAVEPAVDFGKLLELREVLGRHTISLNLDSLLSREQPGKLGLSTSLKKCLALPHDGGAVWFPHGSALRPASAALGIRD